MLTDTMTRSARVRSVLATPSGVHYLVLALTAVGLIAASTASWFFSDDWAFLVPSEQNIWAPHVGHWSTAPFLLFLALRDVFGIGNYLPFAIPVIIAQLGFANLIWRFCLRVGVAPWIATGLSLLLILFGAGSENVLWAFQVGFVGAMALSMIAILVMLRDRLRGRDAVTIIVVSIVALASSGTAIPLLLIAAIIGVMRHGLRLTVAVLAPGAIAFAAWFALIGHTAPPNGEASGFAQVLFGVPTYAISMLTDGLGRAVPIAALGPLIFAALLIWGVITVSRAGTRARPAYLLFLAAPAFALLTAYTRVGLGMATATSSRYLFFVIPMLLPIAGLALTAACRTRRVPLGAVLALLLLVVLYNAGGLVGSLAARDARTASTRALLSATWSLRSEYPDADVTRQVGGRWATDVRLEDLDVFIERGWFTPGPFSDSAATEARQNLAR